MTTVRPGRGSSVIDRLTPPAASEGDGPATPALPGDELLPPGQDENAPLVPRAD